MGGGEHSHQNNKRDDDHETTELKITITRSAQRGKAAELVDERPWSNDYRPRDIVATLVAEYGLTARSHLCHTMDLQGKVKYTTVPDDLRPSKMVERDLFVVADKKRKTRRLRKPANAAAQSLSYISEGLFADLPQSAPKIPGATTLL